MAAKDHTQDMSQYYWESIADKLAGDGYSYGYAKVLTVGGEVWNVDAYRRDGPRYFVQGETLMLGFCELEQRLRKPETLRASVPKSQ